MEYGCIEGANGHARTHARTHAQVDRQVAARLIGGARVSQQPDDAREYHADREGRAPAQGWGWGWGGGMGGVGVGGWGELGGGLGWGLALRGMGRGEVTTAPQARRGTIYHYILLTTYCLLLTAYHSASTSRHTAPDEGGSPAIDHRWRREHTGGGTRPSISIDHRCRWMGE